MFLILPEIAPLDRDEISRACSRHNSTQSHWRDQRNTSWASRKHVNNSEVCAVPHGCEKSKQHSVFCNFSKIPSWGRDEISHCSGTQNSAHSHRRDRRNLSWGSGEHANNLDVCAVSQGREKFKQHSVFSIFLEIPPLDRDKILHYASRQNSAQSHRRDRRIMIGSTENMRTSQTFVLWRTAVRNPNNTLYSGVGRRFHRRI